MAVVIALIPCRAEPYHPEAFVSMLSSAGSGLLSGAPKDRPPPLVRSLKRARAYRPVPPKTHPFALFVLGRAGQPTMASKMIRAPWPRAAH